MVRFQAIAEMFFLYIGGKVRYRLGYLRAPKATFAVETIHNKNLRAKLYQALRYRSLIDIMQHSHPEGLMCDLLANTAHEMTRWLQVIYHLVEWVDKYSCNVTLQQELRILPQAILSYEQRLRGEHNPALYDQLRQTLDYKQRQLQMLNELQVKVKQAIHQLDCTIASMGLIYAQLLLLVSNKEIANDRLNRLQAEITEEVQCLEDLIAAMGEVYQIGPGLKSS